MTGMERLMVLDLETREDSLIGNDPIWWERARAAVEIPGNLKDPMKVAAYPDEAIAKMRAKTALSPLTGQIAMIGIQTSEGASVFRGEAELSRLGEYELLSDFVDRCEVLKEHLVVGWNSTHFDLPFLAARCAIQNIQTPTWWPRPRDYRKHVDLKDILGGSLSEWFYLLTGKFKDVEGPDVLSISLDELEAHLRDDLDITWRIAARTESAWRNL